MKSSQEGARTGASQDGAQGQRKRPAALHAVLLDHMVQALLKHELATGLSRAQAEDLCVEAFEAGRMNDQAWLEARLLSAQVSMPLPAEAAAIAPPEGEPSQVALPNVPAVFSVPGAEKPADPLAHIVPSPPAKITCREDMEPLLERHAAWINAVLSGKADVLSGRANLAGADLSGFDLAGVRLGGASFRGAICRGTNFAGAHLAGANFTEADLQGAVLRGAKLMRTRFTKADLREAEFEGADVTAADFQGAKRDRREAKGSEGDDTSNEKEGGGEESLATQTH